MLKVPAKIPRESRDRLVLVKLHNTYATTKTGALEDCGNKRFSGFCLHRASRPPAPTTLLVRVRLQPSRHVPHPRAHVSHYTHPCPPAKTRRGRDQSNPAGVQKQRDSVTRRHLLEGQSRDWRLVSPCASAHPRRGRRSANAGSQCFVIHFDDVLTQSPPPSLPLTDGLVPSSFGTFCTRPPPRRGQQR